MSGCRPQNGEGYEKTKFENKDHYRVTHCRHDIIADCLRQLIEGLPARERKLILLRYGLAGQPPLTQLETAKLLQISRSYVSRLETHALELLREGWGGCR